MSTFLLISWKNVQADLLFDAFEPFYLKTGFVFQDGSRVFRTLLVYLDKIDVGDVMSRCWWASSFEEVDLK